MKMKMKKFIQQNTFLFFIILSSNIYSQVGINTVTPNSTFVIEGSFETAYKQFNSVLYNITSSDYYITYNGNTSGFIILPPIESDSSKKFTGRIYKIKNISSSNLSLRTSGSDKLRPSGTPVTSFNIPPGSYLEVICNDNNSGEATWDISFIASPSLPPTIDFYLFQLKIPPHHQHVPDFTNHTNSSYDFDNWHVISKSSKGAKVTNTSINSSEMTIVYEYQGTAFDTSNLYPLITTGNNSGYTDVHSASFISLQNVRGKTQLTIKVTRIDFTEEGGNSNWGGVFFQNVLFMKRL
ncbi:hypothetical protein UJ101_00380 [Flavobacteriaceae bacterium UJ101]|nr:hypothetical protein UJ101_00380 [Flavobacteriaceae bacterium UJ101]